MNGCPWNSATCTEAAHAGNLPCLQYAHEQGCAWDHGTYQAVLERQASSDLFYGKFHLDSVLAYLQAHGCPRTAEESDALQAQMTAKRAKDLHEAATAGHTVVQQGLGTTAANADATNRGVQREQESGDQAAGYAVDVELTAAAAMMGSGESASTAPAVEVAGAAASSAPLAMTGKRARSENTLLALVVPAGVLAAREAEKGGNEEQQHASKRK